MKELKNNLYFLGLIWKASPGRLICEFVSAIYSSLINMAYTLFFLRIVIECLEKKIEFEKIVIMIFVYFIIVVTERGFRDYFEQRIKPVSDVKIQAALMKMVYEQAVGVDLACYEDPEFYDTYTKANEEINTRFEQIMNCMFEFIARIISLIGYAAAIFYYELWIMIVLVAAMLGSQFFNKHYVDAKYKRHKETAGARRKMDYVKRVVYLQDYAKELRLTNIFSPILESFHRAAEEMRTVSAAYGKRAGFFRMGTSVIGSLGIYLLVQGVIVARYLALEPYGFGVLTTVLNAANGMNHLLLGLAWLGAEFQENGVFISNFRVFLEYEPKIKDIPDAKIIQAGKADISLQEVGFHYAGSDKEVLKHISMEIPYGKKIAIVGHNGAGKSTLVKLLTRLYDTTAGQITLNGMDIKEYKIEEYRNLFGTVFQDFKIFAAGVTENVLLHPVESESDKEKAKLALENAGIYEKVESLSKGMDSMLTKEFDEEGALLSGGEMQKLAIARIFAKPCQIAILDEPSSALDPISEYEIFENMMKVCDGRTVIFISHRLYSAMLADEIYVLEQGEIVEHGSHEELMKMNGTYADMFHKQAEKYREEANAS